MSNEIQFIIASSIFILSVFVFVFGELTAKTAKLQDQGISNKLVKQRTLCRFLSMLGVSVMGIVLVSATGGISGSSQYYAINPGLIFILIGLSTSAYLFRSLFEGVHEE